MQKYELLLILPGTLDDKEVEARAQEVMAVVKEQSENVTMETMGKNRLAYPVKQIRYGYYFAMTFTADSKQIKVLEKKLGLMRDILRAFISHFNIELSAQQKLAYTTQARESMAKENAAMNEEQMQEKVAAMVETKEAAVEAKEVAPESKLARKIEKLDIDQINKKLDDLISGDVIPGV